MGRPKGSGVRPAPARFWPKVIGGDISTCWLWRGSLNRAGYGRFFGPAGRNVMAHRFAYEDLVGPIPDGLVLDHLCMTPACVNPWHLEPVTHAVNLARYSASVTHCLRGHAYDEANTRMTRYGKTCRACDRDAARARRSKFPDGIQSPASTTHSTSNLLNIA